MSVTLNKIENEQLYSWFNEPINAKRCFFCGSVDYKMCELNIDNKLYANMCVDCVNDLKNEIVKFLINMKKEGNKDG